VYYTSKLKKWNVGDVNWSELVQDRASYISLISWKDAEPFGISCKFEGMNHTRK
jgi:hypothetical protein